MKARSTVGQTNSKGGLSRKLLRLLLLWALYKLVKKAPQVENIHFSIGVQFKQPPTLAEALDVVEETLESLDKHGCGDPDCPIHGSREPAYSIYVATI